MRKLVLLAVVLVGVVLWLLPGRGTRRDDAGAQLEDGAQSSPPAEALATPVAVTAPEPRAVREEIEEQETPAPEESAAPGAESIALRSFHGLVLDALTQRPLAGVRALVSRAKRKAPPEELAAEEIASAAVSDVEGRFVLPLTSNRAHDVAFLVAEGYGTERFLADGAHASRATAAVLELLPAAALELVVADLEDEPVDQARVTLVGPSAHLGGASSAYFGRGMEWAARTDETGRATVTGLPAEAELAWTVLDELGSRGRAGHVALAPGETRRLEVVLGSDARVFGHVRDEEGAPVAGLDLWLAQADAADRRAKEAVAKARSDGDGRFEFTGVPFETLVLGPAQGAQEFVAREHEVVVVDRPVIEHDLAVQRGLFVAGRITGDPEEIEQLAFLNVQRLDETYVDSDTLAGATFRVGPLAPGEYLLSASEAYRGTAVVRVSAGATDVELPLLEPRDVRLAIEGSAGPFELRVRDVARGPIWMWTEDDALSVLPLVSGRYALLVTAPGELVGYLAFEMPEGGAAPEDLVVRLSPAARCTFVHRATAGSRALHLFVDGAPYVPDHLPGAALAAGAARTLLLPPRPLVAELREGSRVVASQALTPAPGERLRVELVPRL